MSKRIFLMIVLVLLVLGQFVLACSSPPAIGLTYVPKYGSTENLRGRALNANPEDFTVAVYIMVDGLWWTKPYWDSPVTKISDDGTWVCDITTGGIDETATRIAVYLFPADYQLPLASGYSQLPQELEDNALAKAEAKRDVLGKVSVKPVSKPKRDVQRKDVGKLRAVCYGPFRDKENPDMGVFPLLDDLKADIEFIPKVASAIRTYGCTNTPAKIPEFCEELGIDCYLGAWLSKYKTENRKEIESLIQITNTGFNCLKGLIVGNEVLLRKDMTEAELISYIREVKRSTSLPVTTAETWSVWTDHWRVANEVDFLMVHIHPYWEGGTVANAPNYVKNIWEIMKDVFPDKKIIIGETGWPSEGKTIGEAVASKRNQAWFFKNFTQLAEMEGIEYFYFELFDEKWKDKFEGKAGAHWGIYNSDGSLKDHMKDLVPVLAHKGISRPPRKLFKVKVIAPLVVYRDAASDENGFYPSGWMGDQDCIQLDDACTVNPHSGKTCISIEYDISRSPRVRLFIDKDGRLMVGSTQSASMWAGIYWQYPLNNWGDYPGYELSGASKLTFWARGEKGGEKAIFKCGGISGSNKPCEDSFGPIQKAVNLTREWASYTIDLSDQDTSNVIGGFCWTTNLFANLSSTDFIHNQSCTIYLDDMVFE